MNSKVLPISKPKILGFLHHAYPLSIIGNHNEYIPWFHNNYIQLFCNLEYFEDKNDHFIDFYFPNDPLFSYPCIEFYTSKPEYSNTKVDIVNYTVNSINNNCYVYTHVDEFFIPNRELHNKNHHTHNIFVYGYENNNFYILGFDKNQNFTNTQVSFDDFREGYTHADYKLTILYSYNNYVVPKFNILSVIRSLNDYLLSINTYQGNGYLPTEPIFGIQVYEYLKKYINLIGKNIKEADIRPLHILWEHKVCMLERISYLQDNNYLRDFNIYPAYKEVEQLALLQRNLMLKYTLTEDTKLLSKIISSIEILTMKEKQILNNIISDLNALGYSIN